MLEENQRKLLVSAIQGNAAVLFLGAGFSADARNALGENLPSSRRLAEALWAYLEYGVPYDDTDLQTIFEAALKSPKGHASLRAVLESHLLCSSIPAWYQMVRARYWYRIYTTNADDLLEQIYRIGTGPDLEVLNGLHHDYRDRDQFLRRIQYVKLNGSLPGQPSELTFSVRQYAARMAQHDVWYDHFVRDYANHVTLLIGTNLNEPLFSQYVAAREKRLAELGGHLPGAFLVSPRISPAKVDSLLAYGITCIQSKAEDFLVWLETELGTPATRKEVLQACAPSLAALFEVTDEALPQRTVRRIERFFECFTRVRESQPNASHRRRAFLLGSAPTWQDIAHNLDAPREINATLNSEIVRAYADTDAPPIALLGSAGCGKSTVMRRVGAALAASGASVFFTESEELPDVGDVATALEAIPGRVVLMLDNSDISVRWLPGAIKSLGELERPPVLVFAARTNTFDRFAGGLKRKVPTTEVHVPHLTRVDVVGVLDTLERNNLLGKLQGKSRDMRIAEFEQRAQKQILVAMREATEGKGFDEIIRDEYDDLEPVEAKIIYLCASIATGAGFTLERKQLVACAEGSPASGLLILRRNLRDVVVPSGTTDDRYRARHAVIADHVLSSVAPRGLLREAYVRLLRVLANDMGRRPDRRTREFKLYRRIINHKMVYERFEKNIEDARAIYDSLQRWYEEDPHFRLQFGLLELEYGELELAGNYIAQAESLAPTDRFVQTSKAHLLLKLAAQAGSRAEADALRRQGNAILDDEIRARGADDEHPFHIYGAQSIAFLRQLTSVDEKKAVLDSARRIVENGYSIHPRNRSLEKLLSDLKRAYLELSLP